MFSTFNKEKSADISFRNKQTTCTGAFLFYLTILILKAWNDWSVQ